MSLTPALEDARSHPSFRSAELTKENLGSVIAWNFRTHVEILERINERLDRLDAAFAEEARKRL